jgi:hypothetical protein
MSYPPFATFVIPKGLLSSLFARSVGDGDTLNDDMAYLQMRVHTVQPIALIG